MSVETFLKKIPINILILVTLIVLLVIIVLINSVFTIPDMKKELKIKKERFEDTVTSTTTTTTTTTQPTSITDISTTTTLPEKCEDRDNSNCQNDHEYNYNKSKCTVDWHDNKCKDKRCSDYDYDNCPIDNGICIKDESFLGCKNKECESFDKDNCPVNKHCKLDKDICKNKPCSDFITKYECGSNIGRCDYENIYDNYGNILYNKDGSEKIVCKKIPPEPCEYRGGNCEKDKFCKWDNTNSQGYTCKNVDCSNFNDDKDLCNASANCNFNDADNRCIKKKCEDYKGNDLWTCPTQYQECMLSYDTGIEKCINANEMSQNMNYYYPPVTDYPPPDGIPPTGQMPAMPPTGPMPAMPPMGPMPAMPPMGPMGPMPSPNMPDTPGQGDGPGDGSGRYWKKKLGIPTTESAPIESAPITTTTAPIIISEEAEEKLITTTTKPIITKPIATKYVSTMPSPKNTSAPMYGIKTGNYKGLGNIFLPMMKVNEGNRKDTITKIKINNNPVFTEEKEKD